mgnify:CR=1 FL=1
MALQTISLTKRFASLTALDDVSLSVRAGTVHALLGENGAGKSTLVKCIAGFHRADQGAIVCDGREREITNPIDARALGIGMVYQHFTLAPGMSVAENLLLAGGKVPRIIDWDLERQQLAAFLRSTPFTLDLDSRPGELAAGEKQKLELLKQLYLRPRLLILDEPTSVLTPQEADEVLGLVRDIAHGGQCTVLLITHKFREVMAYADDVTVLRRGCTVAKSSVATTSPGALAQAMVGSDLSRADRSSERPGPESGGRRAASVPSGRPPVLVIDGLSVRGDRGTMAIRDLSLQLSAGEILGVAGVSGNGQRELVEAIVGQRPRAGGRVTVQGVRYEGTRRQNRELRLRSLPEEPLRNGCVAALSVSDNMALRDFDSAPMSTAGWLRRGRWRARARQWITEYGIKTQGETAPIRSLSGGNVQRAVLARELAGDIDVLIAMNPVFGLDFAAVSEIHQRILDVRDRGGAVLLISEDLDELLELADRIAVISDGSFVHQTSARGAQRHTLGAFMGGGHAEGASLGRVARPSLTGKASAS